MSIVSKRLMGQTGTCNIERLKELAVQSPSAFWKDGAVGSRNMSAIPQPATEKSKLSGKVRWTGDARGKINSLNAAAVVIDGMIHTEGFLS